MEFLVKGRVIGVVFRGVCRYGGEGFGVVRIRELGYVIDFIGVFRFFCFSIE